MRSTYEEMFRNVLKKLNESDEDLTFDFAIKGGKEPLELYEDEEDYKNRERAGLPLVSHNYRQLFVYCSDLSTGFRHTLYTGSIIASSPAKFLSRQYRDTLCKDFIVSGLVEFSMAVYKMKKDEA